MFDDNHMEKSVKSILENAQEEVPAHVWDGISKRLDRQDRHRAAALWFGRIGVAAAAAAVALVAILHAGKEETPVPETPDNDLIAVVESEIITNDIQNDATPVPAASRNLIACSNISSTSIKTQEKPSVCDIITDTFEEKQTVSEQAPAEALPEAPQTKIETADAAPAEETATWEENDREWNERKTKTSLVFSGTAGSNDQQSKGGMGPMKSPTLGKQYTETTIERSGNETAFGIPVSVGTGVRYRFTPKWSVGLGINYTYLTSRFNGRYIKVDDNGDVNEPISANIRNNQHYIGIPLNIYYDIVSTDLIIFYASAGGVIEKCLLNKYLVQDSPSITHTEHVKGAQTSVNAGLGVEFKIGSGAGIYIDPSLRYYFKSGQPKSIRTTQPLIFGIEVGLRFNL